LIAAILAIIEPTVDAALELLSAQSRCVKFRPSRVPVPYVFGSPVITIASCLVEAVRARRNHTISEYLRRGGYHVGPSMTREVRPIRVGDICKYVIMTGISSLKHDGVRKSFFDLINLRNYARQVSVIGCVWYGHEKHVADTFRGLLSPVVKQASDSWRI
jgi:hypothetical protein